MTRIIAGSARGASLRVPDSGTRPTSDRVREALFSSIASRTALAGARVLDLYAGSGAVGLEALSRGAASAVLVERAAKAGRQLRTNAAAVRHRLAAAGRSDARADVVVQSVDAFLRQDGGRYDVVFADPPYDLSETELATALALVVPRLAPDGLLVVERSARSPEPTWPAGLDPARTKSYGETVLYYLGAAAAPDAGPA